MQLSRRVGTHAATLIAAAGSVALSLVAIARTPIVNNDGARYLAAAEAFSTSGLEAAQRIYPWPLYSVLIAVVMPLAGSALAAAHLLDTVLLAIASAAFVLIVRELGADRRTEFFGAALVLTHPGIMSMRAVVVRDFGLWAFALLGLVVLLRFMRHGKWTAAATWTACGAAAVLFRPDSAAVWAVSALAPLVDPASPLRVRARRAAMLFGLPAFAVLLSILVLAVKPDIGRTVVHQARILLGPSMAGLSGGARALAQGFPYPHGREYAPYILIWGLSAIPPVKIVRAMGAAQALLVGVGAGTAGGAARAGAKRTIALVAVGAILPLFALLPQRLFIETRYAILGSLILLTLAPFGLIWLLHAQARRARAVGWLLAGAVAIGFVWDSRPAGDGPSYLKAAGRWLDENAPADARVHTNSPQVAYYSRRAVDWNEVESLLLGAPPTLEGRNPEFIALLLTDREPTRRQELDADPQLRLRASFQAPRGQGVLIYGLADR